MSLLAKKLLIKPGAKWLFSNAPTEVLAAAQPLPDGAIVSTEINGNYEGILLFIKSKAELVTSLKSIAPLLTATTVFWISYPKKSSGIQSDLKMGDWDEVAVYNLQGVASMAVNEVWAGSRFRPIGQAKLSGMANEQIQNNEYAQYIDVVNKIVTLPPELKNVLQKNRAALNNYEALSYSNRKEYVLWILTAKQEKTRSERLSKTVEKLLSGKKNPSEK